MPGAAQRSTAFAACLAALLAVLSPARAGAAPTPAAVRGESAPSGRAALLSERARLRAELDRLNAEIDRLKRSTGVSDRLRDRLADAEGVARRLTQVEAQLGIRAEPASGTKPLAEPTAARGDGPTDLDAKADILADQSRRLTLQADAIAVRAHDLKSRQELRRRSADLDRDPFAAMEGSKRRMASAVNGSGSGAAADARGGGGTTVAGPASSPGKNADATPTTAPGAGAVGSPPSTSGGAAPTTLTSVPRGPAPTSTSGATTGTFGGGTDAAASPLAMQLRDVLDTATLTGDPPARITRSKRDSAGAGTGGGGVAGSRGGAGGPRPADAGAGASGRAFHSEHDADEVAYAGECFAAICSGSSALPADDDGQRMVGGGGSYMLRGDAGARADDPRGVADRGARPRCRPRRGWRRRRALPAARRSGHRVRQQPAPAGEHRRRHRDPNRRLPLARLVLTGSLFDVVADGQSVTLGATAAAKLFEAADARSENVLIAQSSAVWQLALGERTRLLASAVYYEAFQASSTDPVRDAERRDFARWPPSFSSGAHSPLASTSPSRGGGDFWPGSPIAISISTDPPPAFS